MCLWTATSPATAAEAPHRDQRKARHRRAFSLPDETGERLRRALGQAKAPLPRGATQGVVAPRNLRQTDWEREFKVKVIPQSGPDQSLFAVCENASDTSFAVLQRHGEANAADTRSCGQPDRCQVVDRSGLPAAAWAIDTPTGASACPSSVAGRHLATSAPSQQPRNTRPEIEPQDGWRGPGSDAARNVLAECANHALLQSQPGARGNTRHDFLRAMARLLGELASSAAPANASLPAEATPAHRQPKSSVN